MPSVITIYASDTNGSTVQLDAVRRGRYSQRFITMFHGAMTTLAAMDRPACYHRTLLHCLAVLDPVQFRKVSAREIAKATRQSQSSAERSLAMLEADGVLISNGEPTAGKGRRLNNSLCWASSAEKHAARQPDALPPDPEPGDARGR